MILASAITLLAGGPGSGCRGPSCGRKPSVVYHGTAADLASKILKEGLKTSDKSYPVFTSGKKEQALIFGLMAGIKKTTQEMPFSQKDVRRQPWLKEHNEELNKLKVVLFTIDAKATKAQPFGEANPFIKYGKAQKDYYTIAGGRVAPEHILRAEVFSGKELFANMRGARGYGQDITPLNKIDLGKVKSKVIKAASGVFYMAVPVMEE